MDSVDLTLDMVERAVRRHIGEIDPTAIDELLRSILPNTPDPTGIPEMREGMIQMFLRNLNEETLAYIRAQLLGKKRDKATDTADLEEEDEMVLPFSPTLSEKIWAACEDEIASVEVTASSASSNADAKQDKGPCPKEPCYDVPCIDELCPSEEASFGKGFYEEEMEAEDTLILPSSSPSFDLPGPNSDVESVSSMESVQYPPLESARYRCAVIYAQRKHLDRLFQFLLAHLLIELPCDPIASLISTINALIGCRDGVGETRLPPELFLFEKEHVDALYDCMDPAGVGYISRTQYRRALKTLGVNLKATKEPQIEEGKGISRDVFQADARKYLTRMIYHDLRCPSMRN